MYSLQLGYLVSKELMSSNDWQYKLGLWSPRDKASLLDQNLKQLDKKNKIYNKSIDYTLHSNPLS